MSEKASGMELKNTENAVDIDRRDGEELKEEQQNSSHVAMSLSASYSGPLPHPDILAGYENVLHGAAERIISMAEKEQEHRFSVDEHCLKTDSRDSLLGIMFAFLLGLSALVAGVALSVKVPNKTGIIVGALLGVSGIGSIVATFIKGTKATWKSKKDE